MLYPIKTLVVIIVLNDEQRKCGITVPTLKVGKHQQLTKLVDELIIEPKTGKSLL